MRWLVGVLVVAASLVAGAAPAGAARPLSVVGFDATSSAVAESATTIDVVVARSGPGRSTVELVSDGGTASGATACATGVDYVLVPATRLTLTRNESATVSVSLCPDDTDESDEAIVLRLSNPSRGTTIGTDTVTVTITDDDAPAQCVDDAVSDDSLQTATPVQQLATYSRVSCPGNSDWFIINTAGFTEVALTRLGAVNVKVYDSAGQELLTVGYQMNETVRLSFPFPGPFALEVVPAFPTGSPYSISANWQEPLPTTG